MFAQYVRADWADDQIKQLVEALEKAELLLAGWRTTHEEGRPSNAPINSTRQWLSDVTALASLKEQP
jgi:regulator of RNase E activity RraB